MRVEPGSPAKSPPAVVAGVAQRLSGEVEKIVEVFREILNRAELQLRRLLGRRAGASASASASSGPSASASRTNTSTNT